MSGDDLMPYGRLRSVMTPLDMAWSVLKADPRMQAFSSQGLHPESPYGGSRSIRNLGTIDPNAMIYALRGVEESFPQRAMSSAMSDQSYGLGLPLQAHHSRFPPPGPSGFKPMPDAGFEGMGEGPDDQFSVSRQPRPLATPSPPPRLSQQHIIDAFMQQGGPLTPEEEAELLNRLRTAQQ